MPKPIHEMSSWDATSQAVSSSQPGQTSVPGRGWEPTRAQVGAATQIVRSEDDYLGETRDIGRRIDDRQREFFVSCDASEAMQQQLEVLRPEYIAVHDLGTASSRRLIAGLGAATGRGVQKLVIRRQGLGIALATLEFTDVPTTDGTAVRLYTTEVDADTVQRQELARVLLSFSRLGVMMVGDLPSHALATTLNPLASAMRGSAWGNRHLLMLPLASTSAIGTQAAVLGSTTGVSVRTTPQVTRPADAWNYIAATWNRLREQLALAGTTLPELGAVAAMSQPSQATPAGNAAASPAATAPASAVALPMKAMPEIGPALRASARDDPLARYVAKLLEVKGMVSACVFEAASQRTLAHAGARPGPAMLAIHGSKIVDAVSASARALGLGAVLPDVAITLGDHHLVLRPLPGSPGLILHAVLDRAVANVTLARLQIARADALLDAVGA